MNGLTWGSMIACLSAASVLAATEPAADETKAAQDSARETTEVAPAAEKTEKKAADKKTKTVKADKKANDQAETKKTEATAVEKKTTVSKRKPQPLILNLGPEIAHMKYEEPGLMEEKGMQYGLFGEAILPLQNNLSLRGFASFVMGDLDYDGGVQYADGSFKPFSMTTPNRIFNLRGTLGYSFTQLPVKITPYAGFGYRYLYNELEDHVLDGELVSGYKRNQYYFYLPLGVDAEIQAGRWRLIPRGEFDLLLLGRHRAELSGKDIEMDQNTGYGFRGSLDIVSPEFGRSKTKMHVVIQPFVEYWNIDDSDTETLRVGSLFSYYVIEFKEPENNTLMFGARASLMF